MGGENRQRFSRLITCSGSSPRGRGKQIDLDWEDAGPGLIPARAGKTHHDQDQTVRLPAHPRAGGENVVEPVWTNVSTGSSPRGRGKHVLLECRHLAVRLIPARAGKTLRASRMWRHRRAHPRAGGENLPFRVSSLQLFGSSPRGPGKLCAALWQALDVGLIPARAGKTKTPPPVVVVIGAHPRAGGENRVFRVTVIVLSGSSPRGRGKQRVLVREWSNDRLIPARAGKTPDNDRHP